METNITPEESTVVETSVETQPQPMVESGAVPETQMPLQQDPPKKKLWSLLTSKEGGEVYTKSYDEFIKQFSTPEKIKKLHDLIASPDYELYTKGAEAFEQQFFSDIKKKEPTVGAMPSTGLPAGESVSTEQTTEVAEQPVTTQTAQPETTPTEAPAAVPGEPLPLPEGYDAISLAIKANELKNKKIKRSVTSKNVMGQDISTTIEDPDESAITESKRIEQELKSYGIDSNEIYNKIKDLPEDVYRIQVKKADGTVYNKYSKDNLTKLALESPLTFDYTVNSYKNRFALKNAINNLDPSYKEELIKQGKPVDATYISELYNSLNQAETLDQFEQNQIKQQELINTYLPTMEERTAAINRAKENTALFLTPNNLEIQKAYEQSPLKDKIDIYQFSALELMKVYNPTQYQQTIDYIQTPTEVVLGRGNTIAYNKLEQIGLGEKGETQTSVLSRLGKEKILKKLSDEGRNNAILDLQRKGEKLIAASKKATTPEILDNIKQQYSDNELLIKEIKNDFSLDNYRYPLSNTLQYQTRIKDFLNQSGMNAVEFGVTRFGLSVSKTGQSLGNLLLSVLPENQVTKRIRLSAIGEKDFENFAMYMPEKYQSKNPDFIFQYSPQLKQKLDNITKGKDYSDLSEKEKVEMTQIMLDNQDQIKTVTNPKAGKDKNFFSLATLYSNTGMLGDIASFAAQAGILKGAGVASDALASAIPMWTTAQDDYYKEGLEKGVQDPNGYAFTHASIMFMAGLINPSLKIVKRTVGMNTPAGRMLAGVSEKTWNNVVNKNSQLLTRIQNSVSHTAKEAAGMAATFGAGTAIAGDIINREMYAENISNEQILDNAFESVKHILTSSAGLLTIGAISNFKGASMVEKSALWQLSDNPEFNIATIENAFKDGKISEDEAISRKKVVKDVSELIAKMPNKNSKGKLMTDNERLDYFYNLLLKKQGEEQKSVMPKPQQKKIDFAIKVIDFQNDLIVDPKTEEELSQRKTELEELLSPKVDEKGKTIELKEDEREDYEAELEAINKEIDKINKEKQPTQNTEQILNDEPGTETDLEQEVEEKDVTVRDVLNKRGKYNGQSGEFYQDGQQVIFRVEGTNKEYELGNIEEIGDQPLKDFAIEHEESVVSMNENGNFIIRGQEFKNNYSDPMQAINRNAKGEIVSVTLDLPNGQKRTFRGNVAQDIAYQLHLQELSKNNETAQFEEFLNEPEQQQQINDAEVSIVTPEITVTTVEPVQREKIKPTKTEVTPAKPTETTPTEIAGYKVVSEETPVGGERVFKVIDENGNERFLTADGKELRVAKATAQMPEKEVSPTTEAPAAKEEVVEVKLAELPTKTIEAEVVETKPLETTKETTAEEQRVFTAQDIKDNPESIKEDADYNTIGYPDSFVSLYTDRNTLESQGIKDAKKGDVITFNKKDYVIESIEKTKKGESIKLIRVDKEGNLLREKDLSKKEQAESKKETEAAQEEPEEITYHAEYFGFDKLTDEEKESLPLHKEGKVIKGKDNSLQNLDLKIGDEVIDSYNGKIYEVTKIGDPDKLYKNPYILTDFYGNLREAYDNEIFQKVNKLSASEFKKGDIIQAANGVIYEVVDPKSTKTGRSKLKNISDLYQHGNIEDYDSGYKGFTKATEKAIELAKEKIRQFEEGKEEKPVSEKEPTKPKQTKEKPAEEPIQSENEALKDVESTTKALESIDKEKLPLTRDLAADIIKKYEDSQKEISKLNKEKNSLTEAQKETIIKKTKYKKSEKFPDKYEYNTGASIIRKTEQQIIDDYYENKIKKIKQDEPRKSILDYYRKIDKEQSTPQNISEAYHKAKADGSNPKLVKEVEDLIGKQTEAKPEAPKTEFKEPESPAERKSLADKIRGLKSDGNKAYEGLLGVPVAIWDGAVSLVAVSIEQGMKLKEAIEKGLEYINKKFGTDWESQNFENAIKEQLAGKKELPTESISNINPIDSDKGIDNKDFQDYDGMFSKDKASSPYLTDLLNDEVNGKRGYQLFYKRRIASIEMMSPEEYLKRVRQGQGDTVEGQKRMISQEQKDRIKAGIEKGNKIDMPSLSYDKKGNFDTQEGRHRATIAKERGEKLIPVVIEKVATEKDLMAKAQEIINEANKDLKTNDIDEIINYASDKFNLHRDAVAYLKDNASEFKTELPQQKGEGVGEDVIDAVNIELKDNQIRGRLLNEKQSEELQKEIESKYSKDSSDIFSKDVDDIRMNVFSYTSPAYEKTINGIDVRIAVGLIREMPEGGKKRSILIYADGKIVGEFYSLNDAKQVVKYIEDNLIKSLPTKAELPQQKGAVEAKPEAPAKEFKEPKTDAERKSIADQLRQLKSGKGKAYDAVLGIPVAVWDGTVELIAKAIEGGTAVADALKRGINYIEKNHRGRWDKKGFNDKVIESLGLKGINVSGEDIIVKPLKDKQSAELINGFYSPLEQGILDAKIEKATGKEWAKKLEGTTEGDELRFTGMSDFLSENADKTLTKQEVLDYMKNNRIEINEIVKGEKNPFENQEIIDDIYNSVRGEFAKNNKIDLIDENENNPLDLFYKNPNAETYKELEKFGDNNNVFVSEYPAEDSTKYFGYQLPGESSNYKEVLVTLPEKTKKSTYSVEELGGNLFQVIDDSTGAAVSSFKKGRKEAEDFAEYLRKENDKIKDKLKGQNFYSSHYDEPNILAHIRMNTRVDAEGNKVLHIEEFQSDWGQQGKKKGFDVSPDKKEELSNLQDKLYKLSLEKESLFKTEKIGNTGTIKDFKQTIIDKKRYEEINKEISILENKQSKLKKGDIPQAPFVTETANWVKLAWKVALKEAIKEGADKITWTTGEQQNERYDLSKSVKRIDFIRVSEDRYKYEARDLDSKRIAYDDNGTTSLKDIENMFGKDIAEKVKADKKGDLRLEGEGLKVGGTGMRGFYGSPKEGKLGIVGEVAKSLFKQEPKTTELDTKTIKLSSEAERKMAEEGWTSGEPSKEAYSIQHSIDITPEIKEGVKAGMAMFKSPFQKLADTFRSLKSDPNQAYESILGIPVAVWDGIMEAAAKAAELTEDVVKITKDAINHLKNTDWYKNLSSTEKTKAEANVINKIKDALGIEAETEQKESVTIETKYPYLYTGSDKKRVAGLMRNLMEAENVSNRTKQLLKKDEGLEYAVASNVDAEIMAGDVIKSFGEKDALQIARQTDMHPSVRSAIYAKLIDSAYEKELNAKTNKEKTAAAEKWAELSKEYSKQLTAGGQFTAYAGHYYRTSPMGFVMRENAIRADLFEDWLKGREESYSDIYKQIIESPEFKREVSKAAEEGIKEERKARREKRDKNIDDFFDSAKMKGGTYSTLIPPALWNKTMDAMKLAVKAGDRVVDIVQKAIEDISKEIGDAWDKEKFRKDFESALTKVADEGQKERLGITDLESKIKSLEKQIEDYKEKIAKGGEAGKKKEVKFSNNPEVQKLIEERDRLKKENEELLKASKQGKYSDEARNEAAQKAAQKAIDDLEVRLRNNDLAIERSEKLNETDKTKELREKRKQLSKELDDRRRAAKVGKYSDQAKAIAEAKRKQERINELNRRIDEQDFSSEVYKAKKAKDALQVQLDEVRERYKQEREKSKEWKEKKARQFLEKFKDKWPGLTEAQKKKVIEQSIKKIAESGGLKEEEFRKFVAEALGIKEVTPEEAKEMEDLTATINKVDDALQAMLQNPTPATIAAYQQAKQAASLAGLRLKTMVTTKEDIAATYKSIITGSLLGIITNVTNLLSNIIYQASVRFETAALKQAGELGTYGSSVIANRLFNTRLYEPTSNLIEAQKGYLSGQKAGWKTGWFDFYNNTQQKDYFSKNTYRSTLDPKGALKDIKDWWRGEKYLTKGQLHDRVVRMTLGWQPDFILRAMSFGDRPFRWSAEQSKARQIAVMEMKLKDTNQINAFLMNPKAFAEKLFIDRGESQDKAEAKAQEIEDRILEEGNKAVFEVETVLSWVSKKFDEILTAKKDETWNKKALKNFASVLKTSQLPFIRIPAYMYWTMYKIINPEISLIQMAYHFGEAKYWESKGEGAKSRAAFEKGKDDAYLAAYGAAVGLAVTSLVGGGYVRPSNDEETKAREAAGEKTFGKQGVFNLGRAMGTSDWWVSLKWFGPLGAALDTRAKINEERQKEFVKTGVPEEFTLIDDATDNLTQGAKDAMNNLVFDNASRIANSIKTPETAGKEWMVYNANTMQKMFTGATYAQISKAMLPYQANTKADGMIEEINNNAKTQNVLYRFIVGKPSPKISIWGEPIKQDNTLSGVMFNILGWEKENPNQYGAILFRDYLDTKDDRFFPVPEDKTFTVDGKRIDLTQEQKNDLDKFVGQARKNMVGPFVYDLVATNAYTDATELDPSKNKVYSQLKPKEKIEALTWVYKAAKDSGYAKFKAKYPQFLGVDDKAKEMVDKAMREARKTLIDVDIINKGGEIKKP